MFWRAKSRCVGIGDTDMDYISFGKGSDVLVMLPGLGDGLTTVKGMAITLAMMYRVFAKDYKVYVFSRKNHLEEGCSTRDMAHDQAEAMKSLGISKAKVWGISQGGMIAQYLAIDHPELVEKLILTVTLSRQYETTQAVIRDWITLAEQGNYKFLMIDTAEKSYSDHYLKKHRWLYPLLGRIGKPKDFSRFLIQAASCLRHDAYAQLEHIVCPTLVIGADNDKVIDVSASVELAGQIKESELFVYKGLSHAVYEEAKDFNKRVLYYLNTEK